MGGGNFKDFKAKICEISKVKVSSCSGKVWSKFKVDNGGRAIHVLVVVFCAESESAKRFQ